MSKFAVMLVEDNPDDERLARRALRTLEPEIELEVAHDGQEAIEQLTACGDHLPRLVLLDLRLPKVGGKDVLRWIRTREALSSTPVVVLTSSDEFSDRLECQRLHANSFVQKPVDFDRFLEVFRRTVEYWLTINLPAAEVEVDRCRLCL